MQENVIQSEIIGILYKLANAESLNSGEQRQLNDWIQDSERKKAFVQSIMDEDMLLQELILRYNFELGDEWQKMSKRMENNQPASADQEKAVRARHLPFYARPFFRYAAVLLITAGLGGYFWYSRVSKQPLTTNAALVAQQQDIAPGSDKATLILSDGRRIELKDGKEILDDAGVRITKGSGELIYGKTDIVALNTMTTPRGGQYKLVLPDGTRVWLNAASSITYPTAFTGADRQVKITGEVYFEVFKDKSKRFRVETPNGPAIEVLGTHFNVNAYQDEPAVVATLLEGSVKIDNSILHPGEAYCNGSVAKADVMQAIAWKEGKFSFQDADIRTVMRQLSRWYDVEVEFHGRPKDRFFAIIKRSLSLSELLQALQASGSVKFKISDKKIIVE
ncbi:MAG: FecR family protein [Chitinophagaceae bacterium]|nr:FecR family protein [Chitinophagaceae bacterium]